MGELNVSSAKDHLSRMDFIQHLVRDVDALELMLQKQMFEDDVVRIGAEQEICLVDGHYRPAGISLDLLRAIDDPHFTTELASYNIEINLDPLELTGNCFAETAGQLNRLLKKGREAANGLGVKLLLAGILPTLGKKEVGLDYLTPIARYKALNKVLTETKGGNFNLKIRGVDELFLKHGSVMFEACNTSFQLHLQIPSTDFISSYNWSQAIAGPVLSVCCNAPMLMGRELWKETRIALFQQSLDTRKISATLHNQSPRVGFGDHWETGSVATIFKKDISKHRVLLTKAIEEDSLALAKAGQVPQLAALRLHNGTVYRWNRPCYGIGGGKPHLRIENRYIPSGPSTKDELANFAFWVGLMMGRPKDYDDMPGKMDFKMVKANFIKAARTGRETIFSWMGQLRSAKDLVTNELLPMAKRGLEKCQVDPADITSLLDIIAQRAETQTGDSWQVNNMRSLKKKCKTDRALVLLTKAIYDNQQTGRPVHLWPAVDVEKDTAEHRHRLVSEIMTTHLYKMHTEDTVAMALAIMDWNQINHVPVEDNKGKLKGLLTRSHLNGLPDQAKLPAKKVSEVMIKAVTTTTADTLVETASQIMTATGFGCLPVCSEGRLVGIISKKDIP
ncbi:CBS domain-containing protein [Maribacter sp. 2307ULW6-5]|uniref:CBS domain-containing protein n=1 Tax=Maribacter sp. 2307ULW6-5 TaxID=3386275 RepID=UPI0039BC2499